MKGRVAAAGRGGPNELAGILGDSVLRGLLVSIEEIALADGRADESVLVTLLGRSRRREAVSVSIDFDASD